jgi:hypothetical protein
VFQSYTFQYKTYDWKVKKWLYDITIADPDFGKETVVDVAVPLAQSSAIRGWSVAAMIAIIKLYSGRGYSADQVAKNLWLLFESNHRLLPWWTVNKQIKWCLKNLSEYRPYHETIQMLMLFS